MHFHQQPCSPAYPRNITARIYSQKYMLTKSVIFNTSNLSIKVVFSVSTTDSCSNYNKRFPEGTNQHRMTKTVRVLCGVLREDDASSDEGQSL